MAQIFHERSNTIIRVCILAVIVFTSLLGWAVHAGYWSPYATRMYIPLEQPVPFSHKHHVGELGIDCRYCHTSVEKSASAGLPPTETCMTCHSRLYNTAPLLAPVRKSLATQTPLRWNRVNSVPDFVFFNHSIHVSKGVGCATCHGPVDIMPLTWKSHTLYMKWCLDCHRDPAQFVRPREEVFNMNWIAPANQREQGAKLVAEYHINTTQLTDCSMCHR